MPCASAGLSVSRRPAGEPRKLDRFFQKITCGSGVFRHNGTLAAKEGVHEAGLARVDRAGEGYGHAFAPAAGPLESGEQGGHRRLHVRDGGEEAFLRQAFHVFLGEVHGKADLRPQMLHAFPQIADALPEHAVEFGGCKPRAFLGRRGDHFGDGFGLRQIHPAVEEGAAGEFPPLRKACPRAEAGFKHRRQQDGAAVALEFRHIFPGEGLGAGHKHRQRIVERVAFRVLNAPAPQDPRLIAALSGRCEQLLEYGQRAGATDPDNADASGTGGRRYGRYRIGGHVWLLRRGRIIRGKTFSGSGERPHVFPLPFHFLFQSSFNAG